jgi:hypothetical protein
MINFLVDRLHVSTSDRDVVREIYRHIRKPNECPRKVRHEAYRAALKRHHENQGLYQAVQTGRF